MIRGILSTVEPQAIAPGAFYLQQSYGAAPRLILATVLRSQAEDQNDRYYGVVFEPGAKPEIYVNELEGHTPYALMPEVSLRIDPPSLSGSRSYENIRAGTMFVVGQIPYVAAFSGRIGYWVVNLATGEIEQRNFAAEPWVSFSRWQLVVDENGEEVPIASFGEAPASG